MYSISEQQNDVTLMLRCNSSLHWSQAWKAECNQQILCHRDSYKSGNIIPI